MSARMRTMSASSDASPTSKLRAGEAAAGGEGAFVGNCNRVQRGTVRMRMNWCGGGSNLRSHTPLLTRIVRGTSVAMATQAAAAASTGILTQGGCARPS